MHYISTRGLAPKVTGAQALLNGIAPDGGLYIPTITPAKMYPTVNGRLKRENKTPTVAATAITILRSAKNENVSGIRLSEKQHKLYVIVP